MGYWRNATTYEEGGGAQRTVTVGIKPRAYNRPTAGGGSVLTAIPPQFSVTGDASLPHGRQGLLDTRFADRLAGQSPQVHVGRGSSHIRMSALGTNSNVAGIPVLDGVSNVIGRRYNGAWNGADLEWLDGGHYVKKQIYLHAGHAQVYEIRIDGLAGNLVASARGWDLQDDAGHPVLWAGAGYLYKPDDPTALTVPVPTSVRVQGGKQIYTYTLPAGDWAGWVLEPTWTSQPGAAEGLDNNLLPIFSSWNNGAATTLRMDGSNPSNYERILMQWSVASIPTGAIPQSVAVRLYNTGTADANTRTIALYEIAVGNHGWPEGVKVNATPDAGQDGSTWTNYNHNGPVPWSGSAGLGTAGTDYLNTVLSTLTVTGNVAGNVTWATSAAFAATARRWIASSTQNSGLVFIGTAGTGYPVFASSDHATAAYRPTLSVVFATPSGGIGRGRGGVLGRL